MNNSLFDDVASPVFNDELKKEFIECPFSVLDTKQGDWQKAVKRWKRLGIKSHLGRDSVVIRSGTDLYRNTGDDYDQKSDYVSIFDPRLCEVVYHWFTKKGDLILDPFAGGSVRGVVASAMGRNYVGIDVRIEQVDANAENLQDIRMNHTLEGQSAWIEADSSECIPITGEFDFAFTCPPYYDLEKYSDNESDLSNLGSYEEFLQRYEGSIQNTFDLLKDGSMFAIVVGDIRDNQGNYRGFVADTIRIAQEVGFHFYNDAVILNNLASAPMRARGNMKSGKLVKVHQNLLVFKKDLK